MMFLKRIFIFLSLLILFFFCSKSAFAVDVIINEFMVHPSSGVDWIELYNTTSQNITIDNWKMEDTTSTMVTLVGSIEGNSFKAFDVSNRLNNGGDAITLKNESGATVDSHSYVSDPGFDISIGRQSDGENSWVQFSSSTKGSTNSTSSPASTVTPTLSPSATPTSVPSPTNTPTPTKAPTPTKTPIPTKTPTPFPVKSPTPILKPTIIFPSPTIEQPTIKEAFPTSVLGKSTESVLEDDNDKPPETTQIKETKTDGNQANILARVLVSVGVIFVIASGILVFRNYINSRKDKDSNM